MFTASVKSIALIILLFVMQSASASNTNLSLDLEGANLSDTIRLMAKFLQINVIVSSMVNGIVTLHLHDVAPKKAFDLLLTSQGLAKWEADNMVYVAKREELIKYKQEEAKWETLKEDSAPLVTKVWQIHYGKAEEIAKLFQDEHASFMSKRGRVHVDVRTNSICMQDLPERIDIAQRLITELEVPVKQILIEARLVSVDNDFERELGINFAILSGSLGNTKSFAQNVGHYSLAVAKLADESVLDVKLAALENAGHARLISSPSLFTANQQPASIEAGEEIPYQEMSESGGTAVVFKKAVLGLKVTPQVLPGNNVLLHMQINQDRPSNKMVQGMPTISTRQILTSVLIKNGHTIVLGGIYETDQEKGQQNLPFVSRIPFIGCLFSQRHIMENKRELLIFVTPKVITDL